MGKLKPLIFFVVFVLVFTQILPLRADPSAKVSHSILMQGFGWNSQSRGTPSKWYRLIESRAQNIKDLGADFLWFPPVSRSVSPQGYLPGDYYDLGTADSPTFYGNQAELERALKALNDAGVAPVADIVVNHRCASHQDNNGIWNIYDFSSNKAKWQQWAVCSGQFGGQGNPDTGDGFHAAPDIDHTNKTVRADIIEWMNWLKKLGFKAWRYDYSKGYASKYAGEYDINTKPLFSVGEYWTNMSYQGSNLNYNQDSHRQELCNWLDNNPSEVACVFDFTTKGILQTAVKGDYGRLRDKEGKPSGLIGWWPSRAVTFLDNHDTGSQQSHWPFPDHEVMQGYAYILTHPGIPSVFWEHVYDWNLYKEIQNLIATRKRNKINSGSKIEIIKAENGLYAAIIDNKVAMKLGNKDWNPGPGYKLAASGDKYAVWEKTTRTRK
ncbi:MAG: alpha-amylase C-terminal beta-sheet domain-containing protein [Candidatus Riflebacteria bacterium]|nr:alpha-amylase C-terminal beta-sheet domain-containing protein [Candidatus Riflebacteria bacterium]